MAFMLVCNKIPSRAEFFFRHQLAIIFFIVPGQTRRANTWELSELCQNSLVQSVTQEFASACV